MVSAMFAKPTYLMGIDGFANIKQQVKARQTNTNFISERYQFFRKHAEELKNQPKKLDYFADEMMAQRIENKGSITNIPNHLYAWLSDYGRSALRPFNGLIVSIILFAMMLSIISPAIKAPAEIMIFLLSALLFSISFAYLISNIVMRLKKKNILSPLFTLLSLSSLLGLSYFYDNIRYVVALSISYSFPSFFNLKARTTYEDKLGFYKGDTYAIYDIIDVTFIASIETLIGILFIFLIILALRNKFLSK